MSLDRRPDSMERITTPEQAQAFIDEQLKELTIDLCPYNKRK